MELRAETSVFDDKLLKEDIDNAQETADNAQAIAGTTAQYFWFLEEIGSVPAGVGTGAHITNVTKEEFLNNPANGGGNLLARSNGIAIRDGLTELAYFSGTAAQIGKSNSYNSYFDTQSFQIRNGSTLLSKFTSNGTDIYLADDSANSVASFGTTARIGKAASGHALVKSDGLHVWTGLESTATNEVAFFGVDTNNNAFARVGKSNTRHIEIKDGGLQVYKDASTPIAHVGYGNGNAVSGTAPAPYFTFGERSGGIGNYSFVEGSGTASAAYTHVEGLGCTAAFVYCHAEGYHTTAGVAGSSVGFGAHAEGYYTEATGSSAHAEGMRTKATGAQSHASGWWVTANGNYQTAIGVANVPDTTSLFIIGNGFGASSEAYVERSNAFTVSNEGDVWAAGGLTLSGHSSAVGTMLTASQTSSRASSTELGNLSNAYIDIPAGSWVITLECRGALNSSGKRLQFEFYNNTDSIEYTSTRTTLHTSSTGVVGGVSTLAVSVTATKRFYCRCYQNSGSAVDLTAAFRAMRVA